MAHRAGRLGLIAAFLSVALAGCFSLGRNPPVERQYVLGGAAPAAVDSGARTLSGVSVGIRRLQLAPYLASPYILVRRGPHQITSSQFHRWGEDLDAGITRAVARYLAVRAPAATVLVAPWALREKLDYLVQLHVRSFEGVASEAAAAEGEAHMETAWEIIRQQDGEVLARGTTVYRQGGWRVGDYAALVTLLDLGLAELTADLVASLGGLVTASPAP